ncbi:MAG: sulfurtransferase [Pseudomonadota bacterium]
MALEAPDPLVSATWLKDNITAPDLRVIEATWYPGFHEKAGQARGDYEAGHIPGAVFFDIDEIKDPGSDLPHMLPDTILFSSRVRKMGIGDGNRLVIYDRNQFMASARVWWTLRVMGVKDVMVLDGGLQAWEAAGGEIEDMPPVAVERHFTARLRSDLVKSLDQVQAALEDGASQVIDARSPGRFSGTEPEPRSDLKSGHMPGARNVPAGSLLQPDGTMKSAEELKALFSVSDAPIITTCGSGVTASTLALALARIGREDVAVYDGSWTEWASSEGCPIETGPAN